VSRRQSERRRRRQNRRKCCCFKPALTENRQKAIRRIWTAIQVLAKPVTGVSLDAATISAPRGASVQAPDALAAFAAPKAAKKAAGNKATKPKAPKAPRAKKAKPATEQKTPREGTAKAKVVTLMRRKGGVTLEEIMKATGWLPHTIRGFVSLLRSKSGLPIESTRREDGARVYTIAAGGTK
jgi:hypothetical protein